MEKTGKVTNWLSRRFTKEETMLFVDILTDPDNRFLSSLEKLALKHSFNDEVFNHIKRINDEALKQEHFRMENERKNFTKKNGELIEYDKLGATIPILRAKLKNLKSEWRKITDRIQRGSGLSPEKEPVSRGIRTRGNKTISLNSLGK